MTNINLPILIFDMDGVVLDSLDRLSKCMVKSIEPFCQSEEEFLNFVDFDLENPGLSRFKKVEYFLSLKKDKSNLNLQSIQEAILSDFDKLSLDARINSEIDHDIFLIKHHIPNDNLFLLSNCDNSQLGTIAAHFGFFHLFGGGLIGTPPSKTVRMTEIMSKVPPDRVISISDSESDAEIARMHKVQFVFIQNFARDNGLWLQENELAFQTISQFYSYMKEQL